MNCRSLWGSFLIFGLWNFTPALACDVETTVEVLGANASEVALKMTISSFEDLESGVQWTPIRVVVKKLNFKNKILKTNEFELAKKKLEAETLLRKIQETHKKKPVPLEKEGDSFKLPESTSVLKFIKSPEKNGTIGIDLYLQSKTKEKRLLRNAAKSSASVTEALNMTQVYELEKHILGIHSGCGEFQTWVLPLTMIQN